MDYDSNYLDCLLARCKSRRHYVAVALRLALLSKHCSVGQSLGSHQAQQITGSKICSFESGCGQHLKQAYGT